MAGEKLLMHMNAGNGECSYASSSTLQRKVIQEAKPVLEDAINNMFNNNIGDFPKSSCFNMADLGCSSGPNTLFTVSNIIKIVQVLCHEKSCKMPEFQAYLNDLPDNDFNAIFKSIPSFYRDLKDEANCFISGVPGSFYERLFHSKSLHLVHSSSSLHWLSQGLIEQAKLDSFNYPFYAPYKDEVEKIVQMEGSFDVDTIKIFKVNWNEMDNDDDICFDAYSSGKHIARTMRAVSEQMLVSHFQFEDSIVDYLFERYAYHLTCHLLVQKGDFFNIVISLTNKK
ncbi:hypothetical protein MTR67_004419 [Solanum verrucosum]|uniref:Uncharacterized protein n=1 Tax=Solanum verrucosum TaxID=315347 RepID=A0AAF0TAJ3_SOLVR|nr:hypothetical protein MTR67_004419 [Solanum verrucosum]